MNYTHLTQEERYQIYRLLRERFSQPYIAWRINHSPLTISREIQPNRNGYFAKHVDKVARRCYCPHPKRIPSDIWAYVITVHGDEA